MLPQRIFKETEVFFEDFNDLNEALDLIGDVCAKLYYIHGMSDAVKDLCNAFYKLRIRILSMGVRQIESLKETRDEVNEHVESITKLALAEAELETAQEDYNYFLQHGKIKPE
jgi:hypothetical protein